jgi:hypothetical protein
MSPPPAPFACEQIAQRLALYDFPWDMTRALELALFRTFASPRIARLLAATGEFQARARRRYDDTDLIVSLIIENGVTSSRGRVAIARMNAIHGRFRIANEDFLYVLSTFVFEPLRWIDRFGWRALSEAEREGWFQFWALVGQAMAITGIPETRAAFETFNRAYETKEFRANDDSHSVACATRAMFAEPFPKRLHPLVHAAIAGLLDDRLREAVRFAPAPIMSALIPPVMAARAALLRALPKRRKPASRTALARRTSHPAGWEIETLGPPGQMP